MKLQLKPSSLLTDDNLEDEVSFCEPKLEPTAFPLFEEIRRQGKLCDVTLIVGNERFSAHKIVLAATIPYFYGMFTTDMLESNQREISMQGLDPDVLADLISFAYSGKIKITTQNVQSLFVGASFLQLTAICQSCSHFLMKRLHTTNVLTVRHFAQALGAQALVAAADKFLQIHFWSVRSSDDFMDLSKEDIVDILSRDELNVRDEEQIFDAALGWIQHDVEKRREFIADVLACVRLPLLKPSFISDKVASEELIKNNLKCRDLVDEAKDYHLMPERRPLLQSTFRTRPRMCSDIPGIIYAIGGLTNQGDSLSTVEIYDSAFGKWAPIEPMTTLRSRVGVAVHGTCLYAIGGFNGHERLKTVEMYNTATRSWKEIAPLNNKRSALGAAVIADHTDRQHAALFILNEDCFGSQLYVCGGYDGVTSLASVECYEIGGLDRWKASASMIKQRSAAGIAVLTGKIYVLGGHDGQSIFSLAECFDPHIGKWLQIRPMLNRRCRLGSATLNGKIYACGGYDGAQFLRSVECYDPATDEWKMVASMNVKRSRVALVANCGRLFAIGGYDGISNLNSMEVYNPEEDVWSFGSQMVAHEGGVGIGVIPIQALGEDSSQTESCSFK